MKSAIYTNIPIPQLNQNAVSLSSSVRSVLRTIACPNPLSVNTVAMAVKTVTIPNNPYSAGWSRRAKIIPTTKLIPNEPAWSRNVHFTPLIAFCLSEDSS